MGDVVQFPKKINKKNDWNECAFLFCPCQSEKEEPEQTLHPMVISGSLCGLFCQECRSVIMIDNGRLTEIINENA